MIIGVPKEIKIHEYRVGLLPAYVQMLSQAGHKVFVQSQAGFGLGFDDKAYVAAGATIVSNAEELYAKAELIVKVKEPQPDECSLLTSKHILFTFLHLAANHNIAELLLANNVTALAYETVTKTDGRLPILAPMSMIAGRVAVQRASGYLERPQGGKGVLLGAVEGTTPAKVTILGAGMAGVNAIDVALGMGADVTVFDIDKNKLDNLGFEGKTRKMVATSESIAENVIESDLVVGAVLIPGSNPPKLVSRETIGRMKPGSVVADVSIDQGGCFETSKPTDFSEPIFVEHGIIHQCITNLPSAVALSASIALNNASLPYILALADKGYKMACLEEPGLLSGLNVCQGKVTYESVAKIIGATYEPASEILRVK